MNENVLLEMLEQRNVRSNTEIHELLKECILLNKPIIAINRHRNGSLTIIRVKDPQDQSVLGEIVNRMKPIQP